MAALAAVSWPALAHAELVAAEPAPGETVPAGLAKLRLTFNEPISPASQVVVYADQFQTVAGVTSTVEGDVLQASLATPLDEGTYTVQWTALGSDGHPVQGTYQFGVSARIGAGLGPRIIFVLSLLCGTLALSVIALATWRRRR